MLIYELFTKIDFFTAAYSMCSPCQNMSLDNPQMTSSSTPSDVAWKEIITKATLTAAIAGAASMLVIEPGSGSVNLGGIAVPQSVAIGLGAAGGSVAGDLAHKYILPHIPQSEKYIGVESAAVSVAAAIAGAYLGMQALGGVPFITPVLLGGGSYIASDYVYHRAIDKSTGGFMY